MEDENYERAKRRVQELKGFYQHLVTYLLINLIFAVINFVTSHGIW
jgi:hypothetical protein